MDAYSPSQIGWISLCVFLTSMSKGGFPIGAVALPLLILAWPAESGAARDAIGFMLPVLCAMDMVALIIYRRHVDWRRILRLVPGTLLGVAVASALFVSDDSALLAVSDRTLKICIGVLGLLFVFYRIIQKWVLRRLYSGSTPSFARASTFGVGCGVTSTLAHAAGPVMQMYLLPQGLPKLVFAATTAAYFWFLNLAKMVPFAMLGRIHTGNLRLALLVLPVIPLGVGAGYLAVRIMKPKHYVGFIYAILFLTSVILIAKTLGE